MALVLAPELPLQSWLNALDAQMERSPNFFDARPVVLDLTGIPREQEGVADFIQLLEQRGIRIIGTEGAHPSWPGIEAWGRSMPAATKPGRPIEIPEPPATQRQGAQAPGGQQQPPSPVVEPAHAGAGEVNALLINEPVRSGQTVVFEKGDVTVLGSVASGAEIMAGGSIHIYGTLRGRAIAGTGGNSAARIFCNKLQAELLAIDGVYQTADDMPSSVLGKPVQVWLDSEHMKISVME